MFLSFLRRVTLITFLFGHACMQTRDERVPQNKNEVAWSDKLLREARVQAAADKLELHHLQIRMEKRAADKAWKAGTREREQKARLQKQDDDQRLEEMRMEEQRKMDEQERARTEDIETGRGKIKAAIAASRNKATANAAHLHEQQHMDDDSAAAPPTAAGASEESDVELKQAAVEDKNVPSVHSMRQARWQRQKREQAL